METLLLLFFGGVILYLLPLIIAALRGRGGPALVAMVAGELFDVPLVGWFTALWIAFTGRR